MSRWRLRAAALIVIVAIVSGGVVFAIHRIRPAIHLVVAKSDPSPRAATEFPDATNTGVPSGTKLLQVPASARSGAGWKWNDYGWIQVTESGAVLNGLDIDGSLQSRVAGVTIKNTRIRCTAERDWCLSIASKTTVQDTEIGGQTDGKTFGAASGLLSSGSAAGNVLNRLDIHNTSDGLRLDGGTVLENSWVHDLTMGEIPDAHSDGIQTTGGGQVVVDHNRIEGGNNCALFIQWLSGQPEVGQYRILGNLFVSANRNNEQSSYGVCVYGGGVSGPVTLSGNTFSRGWQVGAFTLPPAASTFSENRYVDGPTATIVTH